jgi:uncharacterized phage protein (TIGR02218 family)
MPAPLLTALSANPRKEAECAVIEARDGTRVGFTTWNRPQTIDLGQGHGDELCDRGMVLSAATLAVGVDASYFEMRGPIGADVTEAAVNGGKWDDAIAWLVRISPGTAGVSPIMKGKVREPRVEGHAFVFEVRNAADALNQQIGEQVTAYCQAEFGDPDTCRFSVPVVNATVTGVTDALRFSVSYSGTYADDWFNLGKVTFTSGELDGVVSDNLFDFVSGGAGAGSLVLFEPLPALPEVGDTLELRVGCTKIRKADDPDVRTCMFYDNVINFYKGYPDVPGKDQVLTYAVPGS